MSNQEVKDKTTFVMSNTTFPCELCGNDNANIYTPNDDNLSKEDTEGYTLVLCEKCFTKEILGKDKIE